MLGSIALVVTFLPWLGVLMVPLLWVYYRIMFFYRASSRELKRMEALSRSPVYATFSETLLGLDSVRAYHQQARLQVAPPSLPHPLFSETLYGDVFDVNRNEFGWG